MLTELRGRIRESRVVATGAAVLATATVAGAGVALAQESGLGSGVPSTPKPAMAASAKPSKPLIKKAPRAKAASVTPKAAPKLTCKVPIAHLRGALPPTAADANTQIAATARLIARKGADGRITMADERAIFHGAEDEYVQNGELAELRALVDDHRLTPGARNEATCRVDEVYPAGAPTAQLASILFRLQPDVGRAQLLDVLEHAVNPVSGGPKTFVVRGLGEPYLAAITSAQVTSGLVKFLDGARPADATRIRHYLNQQLSAFETPVSRGGLAATGIRKSGLAFSDDTREGGIIAINQQATVLRSLQHVADLEGSKNAKVAARAQKLVERAARELEADLDFAYPSSGRLAYSLTVRGGRPGTVQLEDGNHLQTTYQALTELSGSLKKRFAPYAERIVRRVPEIAYASPEDLTGTSGEIFSPSFEAFRAKVAAAKRDGKVSTVELARLEAAAKADGFLSPGEKGLLASLRPKK